MSVITKFRLGRDCNGYQDPNTLPVSNLIYTIGLAAGAEQHFTTPKDIDTYILDFSYPDQSQIWVGIGVTAAIPSVPSVGTGQVMLRPRRLIVKKNTLVSMISPNIQRMSVSIFADTNF